MTGERILLALTHADAADWKQTHPEDGDAFVITPRSYWQKVNGHDFVSWSHTKAAPQHPYFDRCVRTLDLIVKHGRERAAESGKRG